jgi:repressor LexA
MILTDRQLEVLRFIATYRNERLIAPTLEEIAQHFSVSKITVHEQVEVLVAKGALRKAARKRRGLEVLVAPEQVIAPGQGSGDGGAPPLQILGRIAAGSPIEAIESPEEWTIADLVAPGRSHYLLRVQGDSMIEDHIQCGDLVVVEHRNHARDGEIVVAVLDSGEATLKRLYREGRGFRLQPANQALEPIFVDRVEVRGVVVGMVRRMK